MKLTNLSLAINAGFTYPMYDEEGMEDYEREELKDSYDAIAQSLAELRGLGEFFVFLVCNHDMEVEIEKVAMGEDYDSAKKGKIDHTKRNWKYPLRAPVSGQRRVGMFY